MARKTLDYTKEIDNLNEAYSKFLYDFFSIYEEAFPRLEIEIKQKNLISAWITEGIMKSSKQKQNLCNKFYKSRTKENEVIYKFYKNLFETVKKKSKRTCCSELFAKYKNDIKNTWKIINKTISNTKNEQKDLPEKLVINNTALVEKQEIAENINNYFTNIDPNLTSKIPNEQGGFEKYLANYNTVVNDAPLTDEEVRNAFCSLKSNNSPDYDDTFSNAVDNAFNFKVEPLRYIFSNSLAQGIFPEEMKIARITPICKAEDKENVVNYRPVGKLSAFFFKNTRKNYL